MTKVIVPQAVAQIQIVVKKIDTTALSYINSDGKTHLFAGNSILSQSEAVEESYRPT